MGQELRRAQGFRDRKVRRVRLPAVPTLSVGCGVRISQPQSGLLPHDHRAARRRGDRSGLARFGLRSACSSEVRSARAIASRACWITFRLRAMVSPTSSAMYRMLALAALGVGGGVELKDAIVALAL